MGERHATAIKERGGILKTNWLPQADHPIMKDCNYDIWEWVQFHGSVHVGRFILDAVCDENVKEQLYEVVDIMRRCDEG